MISFYIKMWKTMENKPKFLSSVRIKIFGLFVLLLSVGLYCRIKFETYQSLADNFITTILGSMITIFIIDLLLNREKIRKFQELNQRQSEAIKICLDLGMYHIMTFFDFKCSNDISKLEIIRSEFLDFLESDSIKEKMGKSLYKTSSIDELNRLEKIVGEILGETEEGISKIVPYHDPSIMRNIDELKINIKKEVLVRRPLLNALALYESTKPVIEEILKKTSSEFEEELKEGFGRILELEKKARENKLFLHP